MPLDMKSTRTITRTATIELSEAEIVLAIRRYVWGEERGLRNYALVVTLKHDDPDYRGDLSATVTATLTTEREQGEAGA